jgi:tRNA-Thr(GGU) m(6)t(6)A37 methyltransferase TsaA
MTTSPDHFIIKPIAFVSNNRSEMIDDSWGEVISEIILADYFPSGCLNGIEDFSHLEIIFCFHLLKDSDVVFDLRHPRNNLEFPLTGIFAQRGRARPNKLGATIVELLEKRERSIIVKGLDAVNGTPVIDIKPVMKEFLPHSNVKQPSWSVDLMKHYWK